MTFIPSSRKYRQFEFQEGDEDDISPKYWNCPTCNSTMPDISNLKKGDTITCDHCGAKMEMVYEPRQKVVCTVRMVEQGDEGGLYMVMSYNGMRLRLGKIV